MSRPILLVLSLAVLSTIFGCGGLSQPLAAVAPVASPPPGPILTTQIQSLTAEQLARILGVQSWTAKYSGGPIECWLEIGEEGQSTLPRRIPETGFLGSGSVNPPKEGLVEFWWNQREDRTGGQIQISASNGSYSYGLNKDAFVFAWPSFQASSTSQGSADSITQAAGKEFVLVDYDASEVARDGSKKPVRRVHLKLMGRFPVEK